MKTEVRFQSTAFNCTEPRSYFINDSCFGDDVCRWLIRELRARGYQTADEPGQEDFGWYFTFLAGGTEHCFVVGFQDNNPGAGDTWIGLLERQAGFWGSLLGGRKRGILPEAARAINEALTSSPDIRCVSWHEPGRDLDTES